MTRQLGLAVRTVARPAGVCLSKRLPQLLRQPGARRMPGHIAVQNAPPVMCNDEEAIEYVKSERWHGEEVHRRDRLTVVAQKRRPSFCPVRASWNFPIQRSTVRSEMSKPSIFSSPWIRGAPHVRFSATMRKISSRSSLLVHLLPTRLPRRESQFQYSLNPARCQRTTVSG